MNAANIALVLGDARREGRAWRCRCPLHQGRSLTLPGWRRRAVARLVLRWLRQSVFIELRRRGLLDGRATAAEIRSQLLIRNGGPTW
jgi:hypothetical protein